MNQGKAQQHQENYLSNIVIVFIGLVCILLIYTIMNHLTIKLFNKGVHVGTQYHEQGKNGNIEIFHKNTSESNDTRREKHPIFESGIIYDSMEIIELKTVDR